MPPVQKTGKDEIINAAFDIVRKDGFCNLNARAIAKKLGVSTQPIFSNFKNMEDLRMEIIKKASSLYFYMLEEEEKSGKYPPYKARGMGYIRFAKEEKNLFRLLFMDIRSSDTKFPTDDASKEIDLISDSLSLAEDKASRMHVLLWFFVHGIASLIVTESLKLSEEEISNAITDICAPGKRLPRQSFDERYCIIETGFDGRGDPADRSGNSGFYAVPDGRHPGPDAVHGRGYRRLRRIKTGCHHRLDTIDHGTDCGLDSVPDGSDHGLNAIHCSGDHRSDGIPDRRYHRLDRIQDRCDGSLNRVPCRGYHRLDRR